MKDFSQACVFDDNGMSLENSDRVWMEVLSSSLTKDQYYLYRRGYASNLSEVEYRSSSNRPKYNISRQAQLHTASLKLEKSKSVEPTMVKHWEKKISHHHFSICCKMTLNIGCVMHRALSIHPVWSALSLAWISSHPQYLWITQNDAFTIDFISPL